MNGRQLGDGSAMGSRGYSALSESWVIGNKPPEQVLSELLGRQRPAAQQLVRGMRCCGDVVRGDGQHDWRKKQACCY